MVYTDFTSLNSTIDPDASAWVVMSSQPLKRTETIATYNSEKQLDKLTTSEDVKYRADIMNVISEETITHTFPSNTPVSKDDIIFAIFHKHGEEVIVEKYYNVRSKKLSVEYDGVFNDETLRNLSSLETSCFQSRIPLLGLISCLIRQIKISTYILKSYTNRFQF